MGRRFAILRRAVHHTPATRRPLRDLEPGPQHTDFTVVHFDNCLEISELEDAIPCTAAHLERDISLQAGK
jgi:hypothetical protein